MLFVGGLIVGLDLEDVDEICGGLGEAFGGADHVRGGAHAAEEVVGGGEDAFDVYVLALW